MKEKQKIKEVFIELKKNYPKTVCMLDYEKDWQLLAAARLSAQCTDKRVNIVTKTLFNKYPEIIDLANADIKDVEEIIKSCGLFRVKAKDLILMAKEIEKNGFPKPSEETDIIKTLSLLPGIGRKTANLAAGELYNAPCVVCDTHMLRISKRLGFTSAKEAQKCEKDLVILLKEANLYKEGLMFSHRIVTFGREICKAQNPSCTICFLKKYCII